MPARKGMKQRSFARKRKTKAQLHVVDKKKHIEERKLSATMNAFLGRSQVTPTLPPIDTDAMWNRIRERDENYVPREIVIEDDSYNSGENEETESDKDYEFKTLDNEEEKENEYLSNSIMDEFLVTIQDTLRVELLQSNDGHEKK